MQTKFFCVLLFICQQTLSAANSELADVTLQVAAVTEHADGTRETNRGMGFVVGATLYTTRHTIPLGGQTAVYVRGRRLVQVALDDEQDLAAFTVPPSLCKSICRESSLGSVRHGQLVTWLSARGGGSLAVTGRVVAHAYLGSGDFDGSACAGNPVIEVDLPMPPGTSGAPVLDAFSGKLVGMAQGSLAGPSGTTGFFKPIECVTFDRVGAATGSPG